MWMKVLCNGTAFYNVPYMYPRIRETLAFKKISKRGCKIFF